jgi:hypothetical protein
MRNKILLGVFLSGVFVTGYAFFGSSTADAADGGKNLKVLPKSMSKNDIKKLMKKQAEALGVQCDHCHDTDDMSKDTEKKEVARKMMVMVNELNTKNFGGKQRITCMTCHNGDVKPK